jgi:hypothetical protein
MLNAGDAGEKRQHPRGCCGAVVARRLYPPSKVEQGPALGFDGFSSSHLVSVTGARHDLGSSSRLAAHCARGRVVFRPLGRVFFPAAFRSCSAAARAV